ncbi:uncharacterized protein [Scyliorhinus torazame]|uniref:uncharacterized protein n=1 Tax=Scyliorhinus torazame TaxID=75743 RepID=UPI003B5A096E
MAVMCFGGEMQQSACVAAILFAGHVQQDACAGIQEREAGRENLVNFSPGVRVKFLWKRLKKEEDLLTGTSNHISQHHLTESLDSSGPEYHWKKEAIQPIKSALAHASALSPEPDLTFWTLRGNLTCPIHLICTSLDCGRKPEHPEEMYTDTGRKCKFHTDSILRLKSNPGPWSCEAALLTIVPPFDWVTYLKEERGEKLELSVLNFYPGLILTLVTPFTGDQKDMIFRRKYVSLRSVKATELIRTEILPAFGCGRRNVCLWTHTHPSESVPAITQPEKNIATFTASKNRSVLEEASADHPTWIETQGREHHGETVEMWRLWKGIQLPVTAEIPSTHSHCGETISLLNVREGIHSVIRPSETPTNSH